MARKFLSLLLALALVVLVAWLALHRASDDADDAAAPRATASTPAPDREAPVLDDESNLADANERTEAARELVREDGSITIRGRVVDAQRQPIEMFGLRVIHRDDDNWFVGVVDQPPQRHENGEFELTDLASGRWEVVPVAVGFTLRSSPGVLMQSFERRFDYVMRGVASFAGIVLDPDGNPVADAEVEVLGTSRSHHHPREAGDDEYVSASVQVRTAVNGTFRVEVESGLRELVARADGWIASKHVQIALRPNEQHDGVELTLRRGASLFGTVVDAQGKPLAGGSLRWDTWVGLDEQGRFGMAGLPAGTLLIEVRTPDSVEGGGSFAGRVELRTDEVRTVALRLVARHPVHVAGRVVATEHTLAIGGQGFAFDVVAEPDGERLMPNDHVRVKVDAAGNFEFVAPAPGRYVAWFAPPSDVEIENFIDFDPLERRFEVGERDVLDLVFEL